MFRDDRYLLQQNSNKALALYAENKIRKAD